MNMDHSTKINSKRPSVNRPSYNQRKKPLARLGKLGRAALAFVIIVALAIPTAIIPNLGWGLFGVSNQWDYNAASMMYIRLNDSTANGNYINTTDGGNTWKYNKDGSGGTGAKTTLYVRITDSSANTAIPEGSKVVFHANYAAMDGRTEVTNSVWITDLTHQDDTGRLINLDEDSKGQNPSDSNDDSHGTGFSLWTGGYPGKLTATSDAAEYFEKYTSYLKDYLTDGRDAVGTEGQEGYVAAIEPMIPHDKTKFRLTGWVVGTASAAGTEAFPIETGSLNSVTKDGNNYHLWAQWEPLYEYGYKIKFKANNGTDDEVIYALEDKQLGATPINGFAHDLLKGTGDGKTGANENLSDADYETYLNDRLMGNGTNAVLKTAGWEIVGWNTESDGSGATFTLTGDGDSSANPPVPARSNIYDVLGNNYEPVEVEGQDYTDKIYTLYAQWGIPSSGPGSVSEIHLKDMAPTNPAAEGVVAGSPTTVYQWNGQGYYFVNPNDFTGPTDSRITDERKYSLTKHPDADNYGFSGYYIVANEDDPAPESGGVKLTNGIGEFCSTNAELTLPAVAHASGKWGNKTRSGYKIKFSSNLNNGSYKTYALDDTTEASPEGYARNLNEESTGYDVYKTSNPGVTYEQYLEKLLKGNDSSVMPTELRRTGWKIVGWYTDSNCTPGNEFTLTGDGDSDANPPVPARSNIYSMLNTTYDEGTHTYTLYAKWGIPTGDEAGAVKGITLKDEIPQSELDANPPTATNGSYNNVEIYQWPGVGYFTTNPVTLLENPAINFDPDTNWASNDALKGYILSGFGESKDFDAPTRADYKFEGYAYGENQNTVFATLTDPSQNNTCQILASNNTADVPDTVKAKWTQTAKAGAKIKFNSNYNKNSEGPIAEYVLEKRILVGEGSNNGRVLDLDTESTHYTWTGDFNENDYLTYLNALLYNGGNGVTPALSANGWEIVGWYKDKNLTEPAFDFNTSVYTQDEFDTVNNEFTLYAKWKVPTTPTDPHDPDYIDPNDPDKREEYLAKNWVLPVEVYQMIPTQDEDQQYVDFKTIYHWKNKGFCIVDPSDQTQWDPGSVEINSKMVDRLDIPNVGGYSLAGYYKVANKTDELGESNMTEANEFTASPAGNCLIKQSSIDAFGSIKYVKAAWNYNTVAGSYVVFDANYQGTNKPAKTTQAYLLEDRTVESDKGKLTDLKKTDTHYEAPYDPTMPYEDYLYALLMNGKFSDGSDPSIAVTPVFSAGGWKIKGWYYKDASDGNALKPFDIKNGKLYDRTDLVKESRTIGGTTVQAYVLYAQWEILDDSKNTYEITIDDAFDGLLGTDQNSKVANGIGQASIWEWPGSGFYKSNPFGPDREHPVYPTDPSCVTAVKIAPDASFSVPTIPGYTFSDYWFDEGTPAEKKAFSSSGGGKYQIAVANDRFKADTTVTAKWTADSNKTAKAHLKNAGNWIATPFYAKTSGNGIESINSNPVVKDNLSVGSRYIMVAPAYQYDLQLHKMATIDVSDDNVRNAMLEQGTIFGAGTVPSTIQDWATATGWTAPNYDYVAYNVIINYVDEQNERTFFYTTNKYNVEFKMPEGVTMPDETTPYTPGSGYTSGDNSGEWKLADQTYGEPISPAPNTPFKPGYNFGGWFVANPDGTPSNTPWDMNTDKVTGDVKIVPLFTAGATFQIRVWSQDLEGSIAAGARNEFAKDKDDFIENKADTSEPNGSYSCKAYKPADPVTYNYLENYTVEVAPDGNSAKIRILDTGGTLKTEIPLESFIDKPAGHTFYNKPGHVMQVTIPKNGNVNIDVLYTRDEHDVLFEYKTPEQVGNADRPVVNYTAVTRGAGDNPVADPYTLKIEAVPYGAQYVLRDVVTEYGVGDTTRYSDYPYEFYGWNDATATMPYGKASTQESDYIKEFKATNDITWYGYWKSTSYKVNYDVRNAVTNTNPSKSVFVDANSSEQVTEIASKRLIETDKVDMPIVHAAAKESAAVIGWKVSGKDRIYDIGSDTTLAMLRANGDMGVHDTEVTLVPVFTFITQCILSVDSNVLTFEFNLAKSNEIDFISTNANTVTLTSSAINNPPELVGVTYQYNDAMNEGINYMKDNPGVSAEEYNTLMGSSLWLGNSNNYTYGDTKMGWADKPHSEISLFKKNLEDKEKKTYTIIDTVSSTTAKEGMKFNQIDNRSELKLKYALVLGGSKMSNMQKALQSLFEKSDPQTRIGTLYYTIATPKYSNL